MPSEIWSGLYIPDPNPDFLPIPDPGVKKAPTKSATLKVEVLNLGQYLNHDEVNTVP